MVIIYFYKRHIRRRYRNHRLGFGERYCCAGGAIRVEGAEAEVYSLSGALLYRGTDSTIALPRGVYIVKVAGTTTKVIL